MYCCLLFLCVLIVLLLLYSIERLRKSSADLKAFNDKNAQDLARIGRELERYARLDRQMKHDLEEVFRRLRGIKRTLEQRYPQYIADATQAVEENARTKGRSLDLDDEDEEPKKQPEKKNEGEEPKQEQQQQQ